MALKEIKGNLLTQFAEGEYDVIIHQCNCFNHMGSGIAKAIALEYPEVEAADQATRQGDINKLGTYEAIKTRHGIVINLYGQYGFGGQYGIPTSYLAQQTALKNIAKEFSGLRIGTYELGCTRGGADWSITRGFVASTISHKNDVTIVSLV